MVELRREVGSDYGVAVTAGSVSSVVEKAFGSEIADLLNGVGLPGILSRLWVHHNSDRVFQGTLNSKPPTFGIGSRESLARDLNSQTPVRNPFRV